MVSAVLAKIQGTPRKGLIYKAFRAVPVLANEHNQGKNEPNLTVFCEWNHFPQKREKSRKPLSLLDFVAEAVGFEPTSP